MLNANLLFCFSIGVLVFVQLMARDFPSVMSKSLLPSNRAGMMLSYNFCFANLVMLSQCSNGNFHQLHFWIFLVLLHIYKIYSKPLTYAIALNELGSEVVHRYVGQEPSGRMFNELILDHNSKPIFNEFIFF